MTDTIAPVKSDTPPVTCPAVSVIIPTYNAEKYIVECLDSLLIQTLKDMEVIIVDDCSTDNTIEIVKAYAPKFTVPFKIAKTKKNSGDGFIPRNIGLKLAVGEYVFFMDSDDLILANALEEMYTLAKKHEVDFVNCVKYYEMSADGMNLTPVNSKINVADEVFVEKDLNWRVKNLLENAFGGEVWLKLIRRSFILENQLFFPKNIPVAGDLVWTYALLMFAKKVLHLSRPLYLYRLVENSVSHKGLTPFQKLIAKVGTVINGLKWLNENLIGKTNFLKKKPKYCYKIFENLIDRKFGEFSKDSLDFSQSEIYRAIKEKFGGKLGKYDVLVAELISFINNQQREIRKLEKELRKEDDSEETVTSEDSVISRLPISVIVPMYNSEKYIGECLDSLLNQTFQDFEVIVVDDCSTDKSFEIVKDYAPKFNGRLRLEKTEKNSGGGGYVPRNIGLKLAVGEYVAFVDSDDMLLLNGLEEMYNLAKEHNADFVNCTKNYELSEDGTELKTTNLKINTTDELIVDEDLVWRTDHQLESAFGDTAWRKFIKRSFIIKNQLFFPENINISGDVVWTYALLLFAKKIVHLPRPLYLWRLSESSMSHKEIATPLKNLNSKVGTIINGLKWLNDNFIGKSDFLKKNPKYRCEIFEHLIGRMLGRFFRDSLEFSQSEIYKAIKEGFSGQFGKHDVLIAELYSVINAQQKEIRSLERQLFKAEHPEEAKEEENIPEPLVIPDVPYPAVSVVIPMYNAEEFIGECLESLLIQTFQNFEVIVADDCSTDNSIAVAESYKEKFNGRLQITKTEKNSGGGGYIPRNIGLKLASGEYVIFLDSDDFLLGTALATLFAKAKEYDADVVYSSIYYNVVEPNDVYLYRDGLGRKRFKEKIEDKQELTVDNTDKIFQEFLTPGSGEGNFRSPWNKFVRRELLVKNEVLFPDIVTGGDCVWCINVYAYAKRFLRLPIPLYFYRRYNTSITRTAKTPEEQLSYWVTALIAYLKALNELENKTEVLKNNPNWCYEAARGGHFEWVLNRTNEARKELGNQAVYEILYREFSKATDLPYLITVPFFFSFIDAQKNLDSTRLQTISGLKKELNKLKNSYDCPAISVIIPLYNAELYIGEAIESILNQTFKNFEIIVVDDCSTDSSYEVVKSYIPKSDGRLKLLRMEKNSGCAPAPRNKGFLYSRGEYIFFMDSDDTFTKTALEEMYTLAKKYDADCVYCEKYYMSTGVGQDYINNIHLADSSIQKPPFVNKPTLITEDLAERLRDLSNKKFWVTPWQRLVSRKLLADNQIRFPVIIGSDDVVWCFQVLCCAKRFLRVPNICYVRRMYDESFTKSKKTPNKFTRQWGDIVIRGLKFVDNFISKIDFFKENPRYRYEALEILSRHTFGPLNPIFENLSLEEIYEIFLTEFIQTTGENDVLVAFLATTLYNEKKSLKEANAVVNRFNRYFTSRIDIKLVPIEQGELQIISVSDDNAKVKKADWLSENESGYFIQSYCGKLDFIVKVAGDGQIQFVLKGIDMRDSKDKSKRVPYWVDYKKFTVNDKVIFDKLIPAWHDKPFRYKLNVKADEEIKIEVEWLPHRSDT
ncbi:MAG: glycosyltransferase [Selenomonadaceae bacterium]|nr:glycosyltransferase [Selenomonadaceae bacterium]